MIIYEMFLCRAPRWLFRRLWRWGLIPTWLLFRIMARSMRRSATAVEHLGAASMIAAEAVRGITR